jgi:hypothetical protein
VVNVTDSADVAVRLRPLEFCLSHSPFPRISGSDAPPTLRNAEPTRTLRPCL